MGRLAARERPLPEAGELLAVEALDRAGVLVTSEGAVVRYLRVAPKNPLVMSDAERVQVSHAFGEPELRDRAGALRRLHGALERSLELHADEQAAVEIGYYVVVPYVADQGVRVDWRSLLPGRGRRLASVPLRTRARRRTRPKRCASCSLAPRIPPTGSASCASTVTLSRPSTWPRRP